MISMTASKTKAYLALVLGVGLLGFGLRAYFFGLNRSFWLDEAMLALNIVNRSLFDLFKPLDFSQGAPVGFLVVEKIVTSMLGERDYILRMQPFMGGILALPLMYVVASKYLHGALPALFALGLLVVSPRLIYYASELKQYSTDVLMTLVLLYVAHACLAEQASKRAFFALGVAASLVIWFSHPSLFVLAGVLVGIGLDIGVKRDRQRGGWLALVGLAAGLSFALLYLVSLRHLAANDTLINYWRLGFAPLPPWNYAPWYRDAVTELLKNPANLAADSLTVALLVIGIGSIGFRRWPLMLILLLPFGFTLAASALERYPFRERLLLFSLPLLILLLAEGVGRVQTTLLSVHKWIALSVSIVLMGYILYTPAVIISENLANPPMDQHIKPVMAHVQAHQRDGDLVYIYYSARPAFQFYAPMYGFAEGDYIKGLASREDPALYLEDVAQLTEAPRVWLVFSHNCSWCLVNEQEFILDYFDQIGQKTDQLLSNGSAVYLYDLR